MSSDQDGSIAFLLGLQDIHDSHGLQQQQQQPQHNHAHTSTSNQSNPTNQTLVTGLDSMPMPATAASATTTAAVHPPAQQNQTQASDDAMSMFSNQLSIWMNTNFSFDGPMGHALIADDDKDGDQIDKLDDDRHRDEDSERQRQMAASGAHSTAARDKLRALDRDPLPPPQALPSAPHDRSHNANGPSSSSSSSHSPYFAQPPPSQHAPQLFLPHQMSSWMNDDSLGQSPSSTTPVPPQNQQPQPSMSTSTPSSSAQPNQEWDLTSTLALQHLMNKNPDFLNMLWQTQAAQQGKQVSQQMLPSHQQSSPSAPPRPGLPASSSSESSLPLPVAAPVPPKPTNAEIPDISHNPNRPSLHVPARRPSTRKGADGESLSDGPTYTPSATATATATPASLSERVKLVDTGNPEADAESNRLAIEEDKRRRNTLASARFRIKKKQREAALEMAARDLEAQVNELKQDNDRLRTENDWLRRLIMTRPEALPGMFGGAAGAGTGASGANGTNGNPSLPHISPALDSAMQAIVQQTNNTSGRDDLVRRS